MKIKVTYEAIFDSAEFDLVEPEDEEFARIILDFLCDNPDFLEEFQFEIIK